MFHAPMHEYIYIYIHIVRIHSAEKAKGVKFILNIKVVLEQHNNG